MVNTSDSGSEQIISVIICRMTRFHIETFGCKLNQAESESLQRNLISAGYRPAAAMESADVLIINTCTVTHIADRKARQAVRTAVRVNPGIKIIITGCYAERQANSLLDLPGVIAVAGNADKENLAVRLDTWGIKPGQFFEDDCAVSRTRSFIKIQDGCDVRCAYCVVPLVRPVKKCVSPESIITEINKRQREGFREVVLTGTEIGAYNADGIDFTGLLRLVLERTSIERIRVSSLQPSEITPRLLHLWHNRQLCRHFHLSLQSGADAVLRRMRRRYDSAGYRQAMDLVHTEVPGVAVSTDIICGFPGETDGEFQESYEFIKEQNFARLHIFPFSARPGTEAAALPDQIDSRVIQSRVRQLLKLANNCQTLFRKRFAGQELEVLFEEHRDGCWVGYTDNYIRVTSTGNHRVNQIAAITL